MIGEIKLWCGETAPTGHVFCDGTGYPRAAYPQASNVLKMAFGGNGTTFNVPDLRGRVPVGAGQGTGLTNRPLGASAGAEKITDVPQHSHTIIPKCQGNVLSNNSDTPVGNFIGKDETATENFSSTGPNSMASYSSENAGTAGGVDVTPPCQAINYIIQLENIQAV